MRRSSSVGLSGLMVVVVVACTGGDDDTTATPAPATTPSAAASTQLAPATTAVASPAPDPPPVTSPATEPAPTTFPPPVAEEGSVRDVIAQQPELSNIDAAIDAWLADVPGREGVLRNARGVTMFLPGDDGFTEADVAAALADLDAFTIFLSEHLHVGTLTSEQLGDAVKTAMGVVYPITDGPAIGGRRIVTADIDATNGVVYVIDGPLVPVGS